MDFKVIEQLQEKIKELEERIVKLEKVSPVSGVGAYKPAKESTSSNYPKF